MEILVKGMGPSATTMGHACTCDCNCDCNVSHINIPNGPEERQCIRKWGHNPWVVCPNRHTPTHG